MIVERRTPIDHNEGLPSSSEEFADRLRRGEMLTVEDRADGLVYQLYRDMHQHPIIKQGGQERHFRHFEAAVVGLLSLVGAFAAKEREA